MFKRDRCCTPVFINSDASPCLHQPQDITTTEFRNTTCIPNHENPAVATEFVVGLVAMNTSRPRRKWSCEGRSHRKQFGNCGVRRRHGVDCYVQVIAEYWGKQALSLYMRSPVQCDVLRFAGGRRREMYHGNLYKSGEPEVGSIRIIFSARGCPLACSKSMRLKGRRGKRGRSTMRYILLFNENEKARDNVHPWVERRTP